MKVKDINEYFLSRADWVDRSRTVDCVKAGGDPEEDVDRCVVAWIPSFEALRIAAQKGVKLFITHEPTYYGHWDSDPEGSPGAKAKFEFVKKHHITVLRNHDAWDRWPEVGIPWAWADFLGLGNQPAAIGANGYQHRYDIQPVSFGAFAERVAARTAAIGEPVVEINGDLKQPVSKIGIGTGCGCDVVEYIEKMGCDCCIVCDDGSTSYGSVLYATDKRVPVICVNHCTSEEPGMVSMVKYINEKIDGLTAEHIPQGCQFKLFGVHPKG